LPSPVHVQEARKPFGIRNVSLSARHVLGEARIDQNHLNGFFQDIKDRTPVDAGTPHGNDRALVFAQLSFQRSQITGKSPEFTLLDALTGGCLHDQTRGHHLLVNVQTAANRVHHLQYFGILSSGHGNLLFDLVFSKAAMVLFRMVFSFSVRRGDGAHGRAPSNQIPNVSRCFRP
jgi:hypothetical protein